MPPKASALSRLCGGASSSAPPRTQAVAPAATVPEPPRDASEAIAQTFGLPSNDGPPPPFLSARQFMGARTGYVFKTGDSGLGYYLDIAAAAAADGNFLPSASFAGARAGFAQELKERTGRMWTPPTCTDR